MVTARVPWLPGCALSKPDRLAWLCVSCLVTSCCGPWTGTRFSSFSVFPGDQSLSTFPECILLGGSDPGVHGPQARLTRLPTSPSEGLHSTSFPLSTRALPPGKSGCNLSEPHASWMFPRLLLSRDSLRPQTAQAGNPV